MKISKHLHFPDRKKLFYCLMFQKKSQFFIKDLAQGNEICRLSRRKKIKQGA